jgi:hypothetical protein
MSQVNVNPGDSGDRYDRTDRPTDGESAMTAATRNLTWAIAAVIVIAAIVIAIVYLAHNLHP